MSSMRLPEAEAIHEQWHEPQDAAETARVLAKTAHIVGRVTDSELVRKPERERKRMRRWIWLKKSENWILNANLDGD